MRRTGNKLCLIAMITATVALTACTPKGSVEQHTRHYVYASDDGFDPNFSTQKADTTRKRLVRTVLIFTESSDQLSRATDRVPGLPASPGYVQ